MKRMIFSSFFCLLSLCFAAAENTAKLDPNVFKSLEKTSLRNLGGTYFSDEGIAKLNYKLFRNSIEYMSAENGQFSLHEGKLVARLLETRGELSGNFIGGITIGTPKKAIKNLNLVLRLRRAYDVKLEKVDLTINITLPPKPGEKMTLDGCVANVQRENIDLQIYPISKKSKGLLLNLAGWLSAAMQPSFSELFCDVMKKILDIGMESPVVQALQSRTCDLLGPGKCTPKSG